MLDMQVNELVYEDKQQPWVVLQLGRCRGAGTARGGGAGRRPRQERACGRHPLAAPPLSLSVSHEKSPVQPLPL
jgi:hypothetical protein